MKAGDKIRVRNTVMLILALGYFILGWFWFNVSSFRPALQVYGIFGIGLFVLTYYLPKIMP